MEIAHIPAARWRILLRGPCSSLFEKRVRLSLSTLATRTDERRESDRRRSFERSRRVIRLMGAELTDPSYSFPSTTAALSARPSCITRYFGYRSFSFPRRRRIYGGPGDPGAYGSRTKNLFRRGRRSPSCDDPETS